jgi:uncharacterized membrane protein YciS (DUF1049 family)
MALKKRWSGKDASEYIHCLWFYHSLLHGISSCRLVTFVIVISVLVLQISYSPLLPSDRDQIIVQDLVGRPEYISHLAVSFVLLLCAGSIPGVMISSCLLVRIRINLNSSYPSALVPLARNSTDQRTHSLVAFSNAPCSTTNKPLDQLCISLTTFTLKYTPRALYNPSPRSHVGGSGSAREDHNAFDGSVS